MNVVWASDMAQKILSDMTTAVTGALIGAEVELFKSDTTPTPTTPLASYTLADYTGYAAGAVTWLAISIADDGSYEVVGTVPEFRPTGTATANNIYGWILTDGAGVLLAAARFDNPPLPMEDTLDSIILTVRVRVTPTGLAVAVT